jgi:hypothetical protein
MPPIRPRDLPEYASRAGDPCFPPPYVVDDAGMDIFICDGDEQALKRLIERALNIPTEQHYRRSDKLHFELASRRVGFACIDVRRLRSNPGPDQRVKRVDPLTVNGVYAHQTEVAVMVQIEDNDGQPYWYLPYVLNSHPAAVATGREIYGYPKQHARFAPDDEPLREGAGPTLFGPNRQWRNRVVVHAYDLKYEDDRDELAEFALTPVLEFRKDDTPEADLAAGRPLEPPAAPAGRSRPDDFQIYPGRPTVAADAATADGGEAARSSTAATGSASDPEVPQDQAGPDFLDRIRSDVPYVFLRQFRDPERESHASYQAIVTGRLVPDSADNLRVAEQPERFSVALPWAYNLALAEEIFGYAQRRGKTIPKPVVALLTGENATFNVLRAQILWQFGCDNGTDESVSSQLERRPNELPARSAGSGS